MSTTVIPLLTGGRIWGRLRLEMKLLVVFLGVSLFVDIVTIYLGNTGRDFEWIQFAYTLTEYSLLAVILSFWQDDARIRKAFRLSIPVFGLVCVVTVATLKVVTTINQFTISLANALYVVMAVLALLGRQRNDLGLIHRDERFWVGSAVLVWSAGDLVIYAFILILPVNLVAKLWYVHSFLNVAANLLYTGGFLCQYRR